ncbi:MAG: SusD/RagB family nutrient-binding outer membrane lipoprotein, partial [Flavihumibacter sp.]
GVAADATSKPINYVDPLDSRNNFTAVSAVTVAWNDADSKELKLEKIITQKYINNFTNGLESWVDFRRTGYPKIPHVAKNDSSPDWGVIASDQWIKRMPFVTAERTSNANGVADAVAKMGTGAQDDIATRLWWDTGGSNF